jgi:predicted nucleotidyltransferase
MVSSQIIDNDFENVPPFFKKYLKWFLDFLEKKLNNNNILSIILYGSIARNTWNEESDVDLLLILNNTFFETHSKDDISNLIIDFYNQIREEKGYDKYKFHPIQVLSLNKSELKKFRTLFYDIAMDGIRLWDKNEIGLEFMKQIKNRIKEKGLQRVFVDEDDFYWKRREVKFGEIIEL